MARGATGSGSSCTALALAMALAACAGSSSDRHTPQPSGLRPAPATAGPAPGSPPEARSEAEPTGAPRPSAAVSAAPQLRTGGRTSCRAPSLSIRSERDWREAAALADCRHRPTGEQQHANRCGHGAARRPLDLDRLDSAVLDFDEATSRKVRALAARGRQSGRRPRVLGLIGDSVTADPRFLAAYSSSTADNFTLAAEVALRLRTTVDGDGDRTIIDYYRGADAHLGRDSFRAQRAARNGAHSSWALSEGRAPASSPAAAMIRALSPSVVLVMYGSNDATTRFMPLDELAAGFDRRMGRIIDLLEESGIIPVLSTLPRHLTDPTHPNCDRRPGDLSNWRWAVQNNRLSAVVAELACRRHLPLIDLRHAMDGLVNFGIEADGSHPNGYIPGSARLDADGLQCGFNVRNYVTLRMLKQIKEHLENNGIDR